MNLNLHWDGTQCILDHTNRLLSNRDAHGDDCRRFCFPQEDKRVVLYNWPQAVFDNTGFRRGAL